MHLKTTKLLTTVLIFATPALVNAAGCDKWIAKVESSQGRVLRQEPKASDWQVITQEQTLCSGDKIRTAKWSRATLVLSNHAVVTLDQNSTLSFSPPKDNRHWLINLMQGISFFRSRQSQQIEIETPFINAVHRGTEFVVSVDSGQSQITVLDGQVEAHNKNGNVLINKGYTGVADASHAPHVQALTISPQDAVQWSLYYPPLIETNAQNELAPVLQAYQQGDIQLALDKLEQMPVSQQNDQNLILKATLLLNVGQVEKAQSIIKQSQAISANNSDAFALQSVIAVAKNQQQSALELANKAIAANPKSVVAKIAQSYAYQALFNIDEASKSAQAATQLSPNNALAWARLSELQMAKGEQNAALESAKKAQTLNPSLARSQIILGFAELAQTDINAAQNAFKQAINFDSSDPLARLGMGLAKIRKGDVEAGKDDLETAVSLDPNNAVLRSYLGKAFYELRDKNYASTEYKLAKEMDPKDPTPWFYDAILKQTTNRPVEALQDMQKAIELNDNRGVYRSKLLLDSDNAARSASLGRIYNDLGFQQRGLLEGWNSINSDPSNYSAHRLLADNYAAMPRHEIARVSELLKSQLLQPVNITPVQPQAADSNILILDSLGPSITSFNEYNPLFTRDRFAFQATGFYGSQDTKSDEVVHSGVWDKFSYSLGQFHYQTDGFRPNNQQKKDAYNVFAQGEVAKDTTLQFEYRRSEREFGDINQGFFTNNYSNVAKGQIETNIFRGGGHHKFSENSDLLMSIVHREEQSSGVEASQFGSAELSRKNNGTQYELQQIYRTKYLDLSAGMNYLINQNDAAGATISINGLPAFNLKTNDDAEHKAFYVYANAKPFPELTLTLGLTQDFYDLKKVVDLVSFLHASARLERNPLNPKFGLLWTPTKDTTFRFAAFQSLKRGIIQNQTLEPTQISGFNQFYDDVDGTIAKRIGFGIDHKLNSKLFVGAEVSRRYLDLPFMNVNNDAKFISTNWNEKNARAYLNWVPNELVSFGLDYSYEKLNRNKQYFESSNYNNNSFTHLETHRSQAYVSFFHPSGLLSKFNVGYISQHEDFVVQGLGKTLPANSGFWLLDTELGYRLPKRHGIVTLGIKNLLDERFNYQGVDINQPALPQGRFFFSRLTLSF